MGAFTYVIPYAPGDEGCIIYIDLVLPMGWVEPPMFFYAFQETLTDMENALADTDFPLPFYGAISKIPVTRTPPPHTPESLTHIYFYMDDVISAVQGGLYCQHRVFDGKFRALKWIFP